MDRRNFFKYALAAVASLFLAPFLSGKGSLAFARGKYKAKPKTKEKPPLQETNPMAKALGYVTDNRKVNVKKWPKKAGPQGKNERCATCMFYTAIDAHHGDCKIFTNNTVRSTGWCNSWTKKA